MELRLDLVSNPEPDSRAMVRFYNQRGIAEQWIKEGKQTVKMTQVCYHRFLFNEVRLWLSLIAYNLGTRGPFLSRAGDGCKEKPQRKGST